MLEKTIYTYSELAAIYQIKNSRRFRRLIKPIQDQINAISGTNSRKLVHGQVQLIKKHLGEPPKQESK